MIITLSLLWKTSNKTKCTSIQREPKTEYLAGQINPTRILDLSQQQEVCFKSYQTQNKL